MRLAAHRLTVTDATDTARLVLLHGFTQTGRSWTPVTESLAGRLPRHEIVAFDLPGHGGSPDGARSLTDCADDVVESLGARSSGTGEPPTILVGYSMGGRVALHVALDHPGAVSALVLVSATAGIDDAAERTARLRSDAALAERVEAIGTAAFVDEWLAQPMFASLSRGAARVGERLGNSASGLADSLRHAGTGTQQPLWGRLGEIAMPVLVVTGDLDTKFTAVGDRLATAITGARRVRIPGAGHTVHLEDTPAFVDALCGWIG